MDFGTIKNVGRAAVDAIVEEREKKGEYKSFTDFCERIHNENVNKKCIESLIKAGTFDELGQTRSTLIASFEDIIDVIAGTNRKSLKGQITMFDLGSEDENLEEIKYKFTVLEEYPEKEFLRLEKEMLGIYISGHPLEKLRDLIEKNTNINTLEIAKIQEENDMSKDGKNVKCAGIITSVKKKYTKTNKIMAFVTIEDLYGTLEVIVFDSCYQKVSNLLIEDCIVVVEGRLSAREDEDIKIVASTMYELKNVSRKEIILDINDIDEERKSKLRGAIKFFTGEKKNVLISIKDAEGIKPCGGIYMTEEILEQLEDIIGKDRIKVTF